MLKEGILNNALAEEFVTKLLKKFRSPMKKLKTVPSETAASPIENSPLRQPEFTSSKTLQLPKIKVSGSN